ncbi:hypothetical protein BX600DRAFT_439584 [Xylariales sp. PMI_506]|nr:hypothetical protein BX600DRAFT_439584 [Xylariales sp. PMI_506]
MSTSSWGGNRTDRFSCAFGRFYAECDYARVERVDGSSLRDIFLPKLTPEAKKHYGVQFNEDDWSGDGTNLFKKILQAGKCDEVPEHIAQLRKQTHQQWLGNMTPEQLSDCPDWTMENEYRAGKMRAAASGVEGLHQKTSSGVTTQTIFMGWDAAAVEKAAKAHPAKEAKELRAAQKKRQDARVDQHKRYLNSLKPKKGSAKGKPKIRLPVGSYIVDCQEIEQQWPDEADNMTLKIHETNVSGIFKVNFHFRVLEGVIMISTGKDALVQYCSQLDQQAEAQEDSWDEKEANEDDDSDSDSRDRKPEVGSKRKRKSPQRRGRPAKKANIGASRSLTYQLRLKCREAGEGVIYSDIEEGTIKFKDQDLASFVGKANLPCVGSNVPFTARKISDDPGHEGDSWADYSEEAYEYARVNRWK